MAVTLQQENEIRARNGMPALTELPTPLSNTPAATPQASAIPPNSATPPAPVKTEEQKAKEFELQEKARIDQEAAEAKKKESELNDSQRKELERIEKEAKKKKEETPGQEVELDDTRVLEYLNKKKGIKLSSFEELTPKPSAEDEAKAAEQRESDKLAWGLKSKKFKAKELESFIADSKDPKKFVYAQYLAEALKADPELKPEDIEAEFNERYGIDAKPESREYKRGQKELNLIADNLLRQQYAPILSLESEYAQHESNQNRQQSEQTRILANAPAYKKEVEKVFSGLVTKTVKIGDESYDIPVPPEFIERAKEKLLTNDFATPRIANGWNTQELEEISRTMVDIENQSYFMQKAAEKYHEAHLKGSRGIVPASSSTNRSSDNILTEKQQKAAERHGAVVATPQAN